MRGDWHAAIVRFTGEEYWLSRVLQSDENLAHDWLAARIKEDFDAIYLYKEAVAAAVAALSDSARRTLLLNIPPKHTMQYLVGALVRDDVALYKCLLANPRLKMFHLIPLDDHLGMACVEKARLALEAGYGTQEIAHATFPSMLTWVGNKSSLYEKWIETVAPLCSHEDAHIREIGEIARKRATAQRERALNEERDEAVYGISRLGG